MSGLSVATIKSPEFINITSVSPLISKCEVKVLYVGANRNMSFISKEVATEMAQSLPGTPIVGFYSENEEDFRDHGDQMVIDGDGIKFNCLTKPYGFVPIDSKVWFQEFQDTDEFGNTLLREYLMCEGYLWTEQYKEAQKVINEGRPHSMELDEKTLKGHWSTDNNRGLDFFIINDAIFSKLCILGEDVEPCFEGSSVTAPEVSSSFTLKMDEFTSTLSTMMKELKELTFSLQNKGGESMENLDTNIQNLEDTTLENAQAEEEVKDEFTKDENSLENEDKNIQENNVENQDNIEGEFAKKSEEEEEKKDDEEKDDSEEEERDEDDKEKKPASKSTLEEVEEKFALLEQKFNELSEKCSSLEQENVELRAFKLATEDKEKDALIESFYMLSEEDKKDVIAKKSEYTLDDIEKELSVICVRKKVNFNLNNETESNKEDPITTFNLNSLEESGLPAWLQAVESHKNAE